jgi:MYXO-CTERM domain-containing protein
MAHLRNLIVPGLGALALLLTSPAVRADEAPEPPKPEKTSKCAGGDAGELGALLGLSAAVLFARRRR